MRRPDRLLRDSIRSRYLVTLESDEAFDGVLIDADDMHVVLADAESVAPNGDRLKVDGQLWLPRLSIRYMQQPRA
jgi:small nuclear ribonucleoprotein (snRNP)-like protein